MAADNDIDNQELVTAQAPLDKSLSLDDPRNWYHYLSETGLPESINVLTGEVRRSKILASELSDYVQAKDANNRSVWVHKDFVPEAVPGNIFQEVKVRPYSTLLGSRFAYLVAEGMKLKEACVAIGITYGIFSQWKRQYAEFADMVEQALRDRATLIFERLLDVSEETGADTDEVALGKLKIDIYKYVSAIGNERLSPKTKIEGDLRVGVVALETGIRRPGDPGYEEKREFADIDRSLRGKEAAGEATKEERVVEPLVEDVPFVPVVVTESMEVVPVAVKDTND